jgi:hypothetical protein
MVITVDLEMASRYSYALFISNDSRLAGFHDSARRLTTDTTFGKSLLLHVDNYLLSEKPSACCDRTLTFFGRKQAHAS